MNKLIASLTRIANKKAEQYDSDRNSADAYSYCKSCGAKGIYGKEPRHRKTCPVSIARSALVEGGKQ